MQKRHSNFAHFLETVKQEERKHQMDDNRDVGFVREFAVSDIEYFKRIFAEAEKINVHITWGFDEQQADPFNSGFRSEEFVRRLKRVIEGEPKTYDKKTSITIDQG